MRYFGAAAWVLWTPFLAGLAGAWFGLVPASLIVLGGSSFVAGLIFDEGV